jgi:membrane fusion protein, multidrug efflux system
MTPFLPVRPAVLGAAILLVSSVGCRPPAAMPPAPPPPAVTVSRPVVQPVQGYFEYNGYLDAIETVQIRARVKGYLEKVHFVDGVDVTKRTPLYTIDPREYKAMVAKAEADIERARADHANAKAQEKLAETEVKRLKALGTAVSAAEIDKADALLSVAQAQIKTALANERAGDSAKRTAELELEYTDIRSPIDGRINRTLVTQGNLVGQNETTLLTTIVRMDKLFVYFDAPERDLVDFLQSKAVDRAAVRMEVAVTNERGFPHVGKIDFRENRVDTGTGTVRIRGEIENPFGPDGKNRELYPGLYAKIRVPSGPKRDLPVIPEAALMTDQEGRYVYVVKDDNAIHKQSVDVVRQNFWRKPKSIDGSEPGWMIGAGADPKASDAAAAAVQSMVAIQSGLAATDRVVVNGLQKAFPGQPVTPDLRELIPPSPKK